MTMVYRIYVEKKAGLAAEADGLRSKINNLLGIKGLTGLRLLNRYDAEGLDKDLFDYCTNTVFSEPQLDDLLTIMKAVAEERLAEVEVKFSDRAACCVIMASKGYPESYEKGFEITLPEDDSLIYIAGAKEADGKLLTNGGRVLGVTELADTLPEAIAKSYETVKTVKFDNAFYRNDIGKKALEAEV